MSPNKETSMLCDIQYVRPNKKEGTPDYLYIIWRDLKTQEKFLKCIPEPKMDIYFEKNELRDHLHNKVYEKIENLEKRTVRYNDILNEIANDMGPSGKAMLENAHKTGNMDLKRQLYLYPYVFGADYDCASWYRIQWLRTLNNDIPKKLHKGFLDIEVDGLEVPDMPSPEDCPINAITLIDDWNNDVYTFILTDREFQPKDTTHMSPEQIEKEKERKEMYNHMHEEQRFMRNTHNEFISELHDMFDESYGNLNYKLYFYSDEKKMLVHFFQLINKLKLDIIGIWNMSFDIPYIIKRIEVLGMDPAEIMSHPDFPVKKCWFKEDTKNHDIKNKSDSFYLTSYTLFYDQMELYASIRKGASELRSYRLNVIANRELKDSKLDYSDDGDIKTLPYTNFRKFVMYNIKDVLLQKGIEDVTTDFDTLYVSSYRNATSYDKVFKKTVTLRNVQYLSYLKQGLIPGENINIFNKIEEKKKKDNDDDDDEDFEGALVADPDYNDYVGLSLYGTPSNNVFANAIDFDMSAFYPNSISAMNIIPSALIFKAILDLSQYEFNGGDLKFRGITSQSFEDLDGGKECFDNFQTGNYITTGTKWMNMPDMNQIYERLKRRLG